MYPVSRHQKETSREVKVSGEESACWSKEEDACGPQETPVSSLMLHFLDAITGPSLGSCQIVGNTSLLFTKHFHIILHRD